MGNAVLESVAIQLLPSEAVPAPDSLITCIYCKERRPPSMEHVLAKSIGGNLRSPITCGPCNSLILGPLDQALAERSLIALSRVAYTPAEAFDVRLGGEHFHYDLERDLHTDVTLVNGFKAYTFAQVHFRYNTDEVIVVATNLNQLSSLVEFVDKHMASGTLGKIHVRQGPSDRCTSARIVMHRSDDGFIRVRTKGDEKQIFAFLEAKWSSLRQQLLGGTFTDRTYENPTIHVNVSVTLDDTNRAVAKTAFNVLAVEIGVEYALRPEFDLLREYVLGRDIRHLEPREPDEIAVDDRFVEMLSPDQKPIMPTPEHAVFLFHRGRHVMAVVTLYGGHSFLVKLGEVDTAEFDFAAHEFSIDRTRHTSVQIDEAYERLVRRNAET